MRTTVTLDDELVERAKFLSGVKETSALLKTALVAMVQRESALRLAKLGGSQPDLQDIPRRRSEPAWESEPQPEAVQR
jgi:hypothetical protein